MLISMIYADNNKATFDYEILEKFQAGLKLTGFETKAIKAGKCSLRGAYVKIIGGVPQLIGATISPYQPNNLPEGYESDRTLTLLLNQSEIAHLVGQSEKAGLALVPLKLFSEKNLIKLELGLARGKKKYDKREAIKKREFERKEKRGE